VVDASFRGFGHEFEATPSRVVWVHGRRVYFFVGRGSCTTTPVANNPISLCYDILRIALHPEISIRGLLEETTVFSLSSFVCFGHFLMYRSTYRLILFDLPSR